MLLVAVPVSTPCGFMPKHLLAVVPHWCTQCVCVCEREREKKDSLVIQTFSCKTDTPAFVTLPKSGKDQSDDSTDNRMHMFMFMHGL